MNKPQPREGFVLEDEPTATPIDNTQATDTAEVEPLPAPFVETWPIKVKLLHKPITIPGKGEIRELSFRQPTGGDINRHGLPVRVDGNGDVVMDERKMTFMMTALTGILTPILEQMDPRDWASCAYRLRHFFLPEPAAW